MLVSYQIRPHDVLACHNPLNLVKKFFEDAWATKGMAAWLLLPSSFLYQLGWRGYLAIYQLGIKKAHIPEVPTICIGNLTAGGSGKTPFTLAIAEHLISTGRKVVISTSGYGSPKYHRASVAPAGELDIDIWGDESTMFRTLLPDTPLIVGHDRVEAAKLAAKNFADHVMLMDDGFQHLRIKPDLSIIIEPEVENDFCFPAGPYREPISVGHSRADRVMTYGADLIARPITIENVQGEPIVKGNRVAVLCAIGQPHRFSNALLTAGYQVTEAVVKPDHDRLDAGNLLEKLNPLLPLVVTAKDFVKLRKRQNLEGRRVSIAHYRVTPRNENEFYPWIESIIDELHKEKTAR